MNLKFIEGGQARHKVVKFRGVGVANENVVYGKGEGVEWVWWQKSIEVEALE